LIVIIFHTWKPISFIYFSASIVQSPFQLSFTFQNLGKQLRYCIMMKYHYDYIIIILSTVIWFTLHVITFWFIPYCHDSWMILMNQSIIQPIWRWLLSSFAVTISKLWNSISLDLRKKPTGSLKSFIRSLKNQIFENQKLLSHFNP
jgi:hypothetical protein